MIIVFRKRIATLPSVERKFVLNIIPHPKRRADRDKSITCR
jgi:hypothetical protein